MRNVIKDTKKHYLKVLVKGDLLNVFLMKLYRSNVNIQKIKHIDSQKLEMIVLRKDYIVIKKQFRNYKFRKISNVGIYKIKPFLKKHHIFLSAILIGILFLYFWSNVILNVNVIHSNKFIRNLVENELKDYGIKKYTLKKSYQKLNEIKEHIIHKYPDKIEWLEIENIGMTYVVHIEERVIKKPNVEENKFCHVVAEKSGIITKIVAISGDKIKIPDNYVNAGDIIISGQIKLYENIKSNVCADGTVWAEVWYSASVKVPLNYEEKKYTKKKRYNIRYETQNTKHSIFRTKFKKYDVKSKKLLSVFGIDIYFETEIEYTSKIKKHTNAEAYEHGLELAKEKIHLQLDDGEKILKEKVLKKTLNNSTIELDIFISVEEVISKQENYQIENIP